MEEKNTNIRSSGILLHHSSLPYGFGIGDVLIYVSLNSADVWTHPHLFMLSVHKKPLAVSGMPLDYFSKTGQLWGYPIYRWDVMQIHGLAWWIDRMAHYLSMFEKVRMDHFRIVNNL